MIALCWIALNALLATAGYLITPDKTPFANHQQLEIATRKPGFSTRILSVHKNMDAPKRGWFTRMIWGQPSPYETLPIESYTFEEDQLVAALYTGYEGFAGMEIRRNMADVLFPMDSVRVENEIIYVFRHGNITQSISFDLAQQKIINESISQKRFLLGTDRYGRDMLSQIIIGGRVSLSVGFIAITIALLLGILLGSLAGFFRGRVDQFIVWLINVVWSIPTLLLVIAITFALGKGFWQVFVAVGLTMWVDVARVVRGQILSLRENEYIEAARALGLNSYRIITRHILPNITGPVVVISAANFASAILLEAGLSFLGIGVQPPMPSWGTMIRENYGYIILDKAFLAIIPGVCIMLLVMAFMLVGNGLRDALDKSPAHLN